MNVDDDDIQARPNRYVSIFLTFKKYSKIKYLLLIREKKT